MRRGSFTCQAHSASAAAVGKTWLDSSLSGRVALQSWLGILGGVLRQKSAPLLPSKFGTEEQIRSRQVTTPHPLAATCDSFLMSLRQRAKRLQATLKPQHEGRIADQLPGRSSQVSNWSTMTILAEPQPSPQVHNQDPTKIQLCGFRCLLVCFKELKLNVGSKSRLMNPKPVKISFLAGSWHVPFSEVEL